MFVLPYEMGQVAVTLIFVVTFALGSEILAPYQNPWDAWISRIGHMVLFLSIFVAFLLLYVEDDEGVSASEEVYGSALVATNICWIVAVVAEGLVTACSFSPLTECLPRRKVFSGDNSDTEIELVSGAPSLEDPNPEVGNPLPGLDKSFSYPGYRRVPKVAGDLCIPKVS